MCKKNSNLVNRYLQWSCLLTEQRISHTRVMYDCAIKKTWKWTRLVDFSSNESLENPWNCRRMFSDATKPWTNGFSALRASEEGCSAISKCVEGTRRGRGDARRRATRRRQAGGRMDGRTRAGNAITATLIYSIIAEATPSKCRHASLDPNHIPYSRRHAYGR